MKKYPLNAKSACLITDRLTRQYLSGVDLAEGVFIFSDKSVMFTDARYYSGVKDAFISKGVEIELYTSPSEIKDYLLSTGVKTLYLDYSRTTVKEYQSYGEWGVELLDASDILSEMRSIKTEEELTDIKTACDIAERAVSQAFKLVKVGITELELKDEIERLMVSYGAESSSFDTIVALGQNGAVPHHQTGTTVLQNNMPILVDMGAKVNGYCSDITRTAFFGKPTEKFIKAYQAVLTANNLAIENITDGTLTCVADGYARDYLESQGLKEYFTHSLGHGVGLEIHEFPTLSKRTNSQLKNGMVFTIEPGVYFDGEFGIRIEDTVLLKNGKVERLFTDTKELLIL